MQKAFLAQSVEQLIRNEQIAGSSPVKGSRKEVVLSHLFS